VLPWNLRQLISYFSHLLFIQSIYKKKPPGNHWNRKCYIPTAKDDNSIFRKERIPVWELIAVRMVYIYIYKHKRDPLYSKSCLSSQLKTWTWSMFLWLYPLMLKCFLNSVRHFFVVSPFEQIGLTRRAELLNIHQLQ
jgi:hypothetical protein